MYVVTGGSSHTATAVANALLEQRVSFRMVGRNSTRLQKFVDAGVEVIEAEPFDADGLAKAFSGAEAAFVMLQFSKDLARLAIKGAAYSYYSQQTAWNFSKFSDEHGTELQRFYNYLCLAYGGHPETFRDFVEQGLLPAARAASCKREYEQVRRAFVKTLLPAIDIDLADRVRAIPWVRIDDGR